MEVLGRQGLRYKQLLDDLNEMRILAIERVSIRLHSVENSL
jgi:hypothetical protein